MICVSALHSLKWGSAFYGKSLECAGLRKIPHKNVFRLLLFKRCQEIAEIFIEYIAHYAFPGPALNLDLSNPGGSFSG